MAHRPMDAVPVSSPSPLVSSSLDFASSAAQTQTHRGQRDTEDSAPRVARPPLPSDLPDTAEPATPLPVTEPLLNPSIGLAAPPTAARAIEVAVEVPPGEDVPLVLVPVDLADGFTPQDLAFIGAEADRFVVEASQGGTVPQPDPSRWHSARQQSDELFRTWYGTAAYMAMQERRLFEAQQPQPPAP